MAILELTLASGESFHVTRFMVREAVSSPFTASIWARHQDASLPLGRLVGQGATFRMVSGYAHVLNGGARRFSGIVSHAEQAHGLSPEIGEKGLSTYLFRIVPPLWLLNQRSGNRIYQHLSIPDIVDKLLAEWEIAPTWKIDRASYPKLEFKVQYAESDYNFLSRLLEEAGIAFTFPEGAEGPVLTLSDRLEANEARPGAPVTYLDDPEQASEREMVTQVRLGREVRPGATMVRDVDFRNPAFALYGIGRGGRGGPAADDLEGRYEQYHYRPGAFLAETGRAGNTPAADDQGIARHDAKHGEDLATRGLEGERAGMRYVSFQANTFDLAPGAVFSIDRHPHPEIPAARRWLVLETTLEGAPEAEWILTAQATMADAPYRPSRRTQKPLIQGLQSATVVGPRGQEIHTDEFGRVRVQLHWDREGQRDERSSCWIRASHGWAGGGFGWMALPRVGQEILVSFLQGDPDQPVLAGHVYNAVQQVPYKLPDHKTRSTWKSDSSLGGGGFNEIMFEDLAGKELVWAQAQKDRMRLVRHDEQITVAHDRQKLVKNDEADETEGHRKRWVGKDLDALTQRHHRARIEGDDHLVVKGNLRGQVDGKRSLTVAEDRHHKVEGRHALKADQQVHLVAGENLVGEGAVDVTVKGPGGFLRIDATGITIKGTLVKINTGGTPGRGRGSRPEVPALALQAPKAEVQSDATKSAGPSRAMVQEGAKPRTAKAARLAERNALIADARKRADALPPNSPERKRLLDAADRLERNNHSVEMARLSQDVYKDSGAPEGWRRVPPEEMPPGLRDQVWEDKDSGFYAALYESEDGKKVIAFRGTNEAKDWKTNIPQGIGLETDQYNEAHHLGQAMRNTYGPNGFEITGHSLGGGLASQAVVTSGARGTTFNSAGLHPRTARRLGADFSQGADLIDTYGVAGEVLTSVQTVPGARQALGKWHDLPAIGPGMGGTTGQGAMKGAGAGAAVGGLIGGPQGALIGGAIGGIGGGVVSMAKLSVSRHGMDYVVNGIESQKTEDITTMKAGAP
ncbi:type VI secretion system tip protein TssI/VgrG [Chondromyces apiculatus]|uniref:VgrG protein n=1 Tax=Chondromyces apiculatus DSM 436 TaxID=1192034 RepID=A0A017THP1_9BACT|nr:type VI secretion system tip protein TssI/VgrG [Chondromyces apiculatus]EYF08096.1 VgrG protein [Chondromyces apiculatus DSM 436]